MDCKKIPFSAEVMRLTAPVRRRSLEQASRLRESVAQWREVRRLRHRGGSGALKVAAGSTHGFPMISHTFVYQELLAMHDLAGWAVRIFHSQEADPDDLHQAFHYFRRHRTRYRFDRRIQLADLQYYSRRVPDRVESLLQSLSEYSGIAVAELLQRPELLLAFTHTRRLELWGAQYIHTYFFYDLTLYGLVSSWLLGLPRGVTAYADHMLQDWPLKVVPLHLRTADVIVATSRRIRAELIGIGGPQVASKILVKPNGVDGRRLRALERTAPTARPLAVLCVARIEPKKGLLELAEATKLLADRNRSVRVHVVGAPDRGHAPSEAYAHQLRARIDELGLSEFMLLHGRMKQEDLLSLLQQADVFVAPFIETDSGDKDGIPTAILEAMSSALPVVGSRAGSIAESLDDGVEGFLVPQRDPLALADALDRFIATPPLAPSMGAAARRRFEREFDIRVTEPLLHERIREAVERRRTAHG